MIDIRTGRELTRREFGRGLAAIIGAGVAPSVALGALPSGLGMRNGMMTAGGGLPYDSETSYIDAFKTRINTTYTPTDNFKIVFKYKSLAYQDWTALVQCVSNWNFAIAYYGGTTRNVNTFGKAQNFYFNDRSDTTIEWTINSFTYNGTSASISKGSSSVTTNLRFNDTRNDQRIYYVKIYDSGTLVKDFIPCRIGNNGFLYEKISEVLVSGDDAGGYITPGPDIT